MKEHTVEFTQNRNSIEIRSKSSSPNVTVYRPERELFHKPDFKVKPGYINSSSFHIRDEQDAVDFAMTMRYAIRDLNDFNSVVPGWVDVENPWTENEYLRKRIEYLSSERGAAETLAAIKKARTPKA